MRAEVLLSFLLLAAVAASRPAPYWQAAGAVNGRRTAAEQTGSALPTASQNVPGPETPFSLTPKTAAALALSLVVSALSNAAGVGGGAIFVPLFNVLLGFPIKTAAALSQAVICGGAIGSVAYSLGRRHPKAPARPLIDFDLALTIGPALLLGVSAGVLANIALPSWLITFLLVALLIFLTWRTFSTGLRLRRKERAAQQQQEQLELQLPAGGTLEEQYCQQAPAGQHRGKQQQQQQQQRKKQRRQGRPAASQKLQLELGRLESPPQQQERPPHLLLLDSPSSSTGSEWHIAAAAPGAAIDAAFAAQMPEAAAEAGAQQPPSRRHLVLAPELATVPEDGSPHTKGEGDFLHQKPLQPRGSLESRASSGVAPASPARHEEPAAAVGGGFSPGSSTRAGACSEECGDSGPTDSSDGEGGSGDEPSYCMWLPAQVVADGVLEPGSFRSTPVPPAQPPGAGDAEPALSAPQAAWCDWRRHSKQQLGGWTGDGSALSGAQHCAAPQLPALRFPWSKAAQLCFLWLLFFGFQLGKEELPRCSWRYGLLFACQAILALGLAALFSWQAVHGAQQGQHACNCPGEAAEQPILAGSQADSSGGTAGAAGAAGACGHAVADTGALPPWSARRLVGVTAVALGGGIIAGTLGIGGGMVLAPLMLELGVHPQAASATSGLLVLFSASTAVLAFAAAGRLPLEWAAVFGTSCMAAAFVGTFLIGRAVRRSGRASLLVLILAGIIGCGAAVTVAFSGVNAVEELAAGGANLGGDGAFCAG